MKTLSLALVLAAAVALPAMAQGFTAEGIMAMSDTNKDGAISKDEATMFPPGVFESSDTNKDGKVTLEELKVALAAMQGGGGAPPARPAQ